MLTLVVLLDAADIVPGPPLLQASAPAGAGLHRVPADARRGGRTWNRGIGSSGAPHGTGVVADGLVARGQVEGEGGAERVRGRASAVRVVTSTHKEVSRFQDVSVVPRIPLICA